MEVAGSSRPCSGAEHLISHALDQILGTEAARPRRAGRRSARCWWPSPAGSPCAQGAGPLRAHRPARLARGVRPGARHAGRGHPRRPVHPPGSHHGPRPARPRRRRHRPPASPIAFGARRPHDHRRRPRRRARQAARHRHDAAEVAGPGRATTPCAQQLDSLDLAPPREVVGRGRPEARRGRVVRGARGATGCRSGCSRTRSTTCGTTGAGVRAERVRCEMWPLVDRCTAAAWSPTPAAAVS